MYKPGIELDKLVAEIIGHNDPELYSIAIDDAWYAWEWLEQNAPYIIVLTRDTATRKPAVRGLRILTNPQTGEIIDMQQCKWIGESYPHAICLAVLGIQEEKKKETIAVANIETGEIDWTKAEFT